MSRDKQIEEMADDVRRIRESYFGKADYLFAMKLYEDGYRKASDVAEEIFAEIEKGINKEKAFCEKGAETSHEKWMIRFWEGSVEALKRLVYFIAELKKKYTEKK